MVRLCEVILRPRVDLDMKNSNVAAETTVCRVIESVYRSWG